MGHVVLLGDSIFDNARYVPGGPSVIEHLRRALRSGWRATLLARDRASTAEVGRQIDQLPADATHLVLSVGGIQEQFGRDYRAVLGLVLGHGKPAAVCTVYDAIPGLDPAERTGLCLFNDVILREGFRAGLAVIDLRLVCTDAADYARSSPIEPSVVGGGKIARAIGRLVTG